MYMLNKKEKPSNENKYENDRFSGEINNRSKTVLIYTKKLREKK